MSYPCPYCKAPIVAAVQANFDTLPAHLRRRRFFDADRCNKGTHKVTAYHVPQGEWPAHTRWIYQDKRRQDNQPLWRLHDCPNQTGIKR